jgi:FtsP/CotA-like multicopper oxidase with cupredoxin domain
MLKCAVAGGVCLTTSKGPVSRAFADAPQSPATTPFKDKLPLPPSPVPLSQPLTNLTPYASPFYQPAKGTPTFYQISAEARFVQFHSDLPPTRIWGYRDDNTPGPWNFAAGPTFRPKINGNPFAGTIVRLVNNLSSKETGFGFPRLTTHLHGGHVPAAADGFAENINVNGSPFTVVAEPDGGTHDHAYPFADPGFSTGEADPHERPSFLWYHDHLLDFTGPNVYRGLAGLAPVFEDAAALRAAGGTALDVDDENDPQGLRLPSGEFDIPMVLQDKLFAADGSLVFNSFDHNGFLGDKFLVNAKIQPYAEVKARRYRLRFLNGSNARHYELFLTDENGTPQPMAVIATEGGLLSKTVNPVKSILLAPAIRFEVIVDFSRFSGKNLYIENRLAQDDGRGPRGTSSSPRPCPRASASFNSASGAPRPIRRPTSSRPTFRSGLSTRYPPPS